MRIYYIEDRCICGEHIHLPRSMTALIIAISMDCGESENRSEIHDNCEVSIYIWLEVLCAAPEHVVEAIFCMCLQGRWGARSGDFRSKSGFEGLVKVLQ